MLGKALHLAYPMLGVYPALIIVTHHWELAGLADACYRLEAGRLHPTG